MKKTLLLFVMVVLSISFSYAQNTMYVMENGVATEYDIATQVDSVIFYAPTAQPPANKLNLILLGDSITQGSGIGRTAYYRKPLYYLLLAAGFNFDYIGYSDKFYGENEWDPSTLDPDTDWDRDHYGMWGQTTSTVLNSMSSWLNTSGKVPDIALIHLGTNDFGDGNSIRDAYGEMINTLRDKNPNVIVFLAQIIKSTHSGVEQTTALLRPKVIALEAEMNTNDSPVIVVDLWTDTIDVNTDLTDQLHPNIGGAVKMANKWFEAINTYYGLN